VTLSVLSHAPVVRQRLKVYVVAAECTADVSLYRIDRRGLYLPSSSFHDRHIRVPVVSISLPTLAPVVDLTIVTAAAAAADRSNRVVIEIDAYAAAFPVQRFIDRRRAILDSSEGHRKLKLGTVSACRRQIKEHAATVTDSRWLHDSLRLGCRRADSSRDRSDSRIYVESMHGDVYELPFLSTAAVIVDVRDLKRLEATSFYCIPARSY